MVFKDIPSNFAAKFEISACFCEVNGKILLLHRQDHKPQGNTWGLPAGKVEFHETPQEAAIRELREETGIAVSPVEVLFLATLFVKCVHYDYVCHLYRHRLQFMPEVSITNGEHKAFVWVDPAEAFSLPLIEDLAVCIEEYYGGVA